jgi:methyl-accepting chemotaxis protein
MDMKSIQTRLTVVILLILLVALGTLGGLNYWKARDIITDNIVASMEEKAFGGVGDVSDWLEARKAEITMMTAAPVVQSGNPEAIQPFLVNAAKQNKVYDSIGYIMPDGSYTNSTGVKGSLADRDYFPKAMRGETVISDPLVARSTGHLVSVVAVPVKVDGRVTGVLYGSVDLGTLTKKVMSIKAGQTGYAYVMKADGLTIIHPDKNIAMKINAVTDPKLPEVLRSVNARIIKGEKGIAAYEYGGVEKFVAFSPIPGVKWFFALNVPKAEVTGTIGVLTTITLTTVAVVLIIAALFVAWFARTIARPIQALEAAANRIAAGDISLTRLDIAANDEIGRLGRSFEQMACSLRTLIQKITGATDQVAASSEELTASSEQSAQAANQIAAAITSVAAGADKQLTAANESAAVVEQMSSSIRQIAATANQAAVQSAQAAEKAKDGDQAVEKAINQMGNLEVTVTNSAAVVAKLGERSKEIGQIVDTIAGIAGQTNLLALNAAIEAARAGEQGRGFAVVAEEVRKLAEQSQEAAKKIADLIGEIQGDTDRAVVAMNDGTREAKTGAVVVDAAGAAFREIVGLVAQVSGQMSDISAAIQQMSAGSQQVVNAVRQIDELGKKAAGETQGVSAAAQQQLASMEEIAASSRALAKLAQDLQNAVAEFRL